MLGGVASSFSSRNSQAKATLPTPMALRARNRRRDQRPIALPGGSSDRFIGRHQQDGGTVERSNFKPLKTVYRQKQSAEREEWSIDLAQTFSVAFTPL